MLPNWAVEKSTAPLAFSEQGTNHGCFFFFFFFFFWKVMPYSRQRKAAKQVMQNLGDGITPKGVGQERNS